MCIHCQETGKVAVKRGEDLVEEKCECQNDPHYIAGLRYAGKDYWGEDQWIGDDKEWKNYEELTK